MKKVILVSIISLMAITTTSTIIGCGKDNKETDEDADITPAGFVDLGLPSGTKWNSVNDSSTSDPLFFFTCEEAMAKFGSQLPTEEQFQELISQCTSTWNEEKKGRTFVGPNGDSIFFPASGYRNCNSGYEQYIGTHGYYWSSTSSGSNTTYMRYFNINPSFASVAGLDRANGMSVRRVHK